MKEEKIQVVVDAVHDHPLLTLKKCKTSSELEDEGFHLAQDGHFQVPLRICVLEAKKIQKVWIAEYQVGRQLVTLTQRLELHLRKLLGPSRKSGALEEHRLNLLLQSPRIPALYA